MARTRSTRQVAKRIDLTYFKRAAPLRHWKRNLSIAAAILAACWPAAMAWRHDESLYDGGPMSIRHSMLRGDCRQCHVSDWAARYLDPVKWKAEMDRTCVSCHPAPAHHMNQASLIKGESAADCTVCHAEHRGHDELARLTSRHCTQCHENTPKTSAPDPHKAGCLLAASHPIHATITEFDKDHPEFALHGKPGADRTKLSFNHALHLHPDTPQRVDKFKQDLEGLSSRPGIGRDVGGRLRFECGYCHATDGLGATMKPVQYEAHCRDCHPIQSSSELIVPPRLPHDRPGLMREVLRSRLLDHAAKEKDPADFISTQILEMETGLYTSDPASCSKCHETELGDTFPDTPPIVADTGFRTMSNGLAGQPRLWMVHSKFNHNTHRALSCTQCHYAASRSKDTKDVLLPRRADCLNCHSKTGGARTTCVECHDFHDHRKDAGFEGSLRIGGMRESLPGAKKP